MPTSDLPERLAAHPDRRLRFSALDGSLLTKTFAEAHADVRTLMAELRACGLGPGDLVGVLGPNTYEWVLADLALLGLGCVSVALPAEGSGRETDAEELCARYRLSALLLTKTAPKGTQRPAGTAVLEERPLSLRKRETADRPELPGDVFSVAFSSGTAGTKKGLMLSRAGVDNTVRMSGAAWQVTGEDDILISLPFSNFQQRYLMYTAIRFGADATVVAPERLFQKLAALEPTIILGPPSFFEILHNRIRATRRRARLRYVLAAALYRLPPERLTRGARARLGRRWTSMYGSRVRLMFTGSAPVPPRMVTTFQEVGLPLFEVYGSTEVGWICFNLPGRHRIGAAGRPVPGVTVSVLDGGELVVRTDTPQCSGYVFEGVESRDSVFLPDGSIATGDLGVLDRSGFLRLLGRKKNIIVTRSGVKINPEELESEIERECGVAKAMVAAPEEGGLLSCVVWVADEECGERAGEVEARIAGANGERDAAHRISRVLVRPKSELTVESGLLTRNLKVDRNAVMREVFAVGSRTGR